MSLWLVIWWWFSCMSCVVNSFVINMPYLLGTYVLRKTNDVAFESSKYTYLVINEDNVKLKTIYQSGIFATKKSRTGTVTLRENDGMLFAWLSPTEWFKQTRNKDIMKADNDVQIFVKFNSLSKYTYSALGVEFPEIKYDQIINYNLQKNIRVQQKNKMLFVTDDYDNYYIFDLCSNMNINGLPYVETALYTLVFSEILGFMINLGLIKLISNNL